MLVGAHAEVLDGLPGVPLAPEQDSVGASGRTDGELVQGDGLTTSLEDALLGGLGEAESGNGQLGDLDQTNIVGNSSNDNDSLGVAVGGVRSLLEYAGEGNGRAVDLGEEKAVEDGLLQSRVKYRKTSKHE